MESESTLCPDCGKPKGLLNVVCGNCSASGEGVMGNPPESEIIDQLILQLKKRISELEQALEQIADFEIVSGKPPPGEILKGIALKVLGRI